MIKKDAFCRFRDTEPDVTELLPNLFLGNVKISKDENFLNGKKIGTIIRILENDDGSRKFTLIHKKVGSIDYHIIPIKDVDTCLRDITPILDKTSEIIKNSLKNNIPVLVHCKHGHHRSAVVVSAFFIKYLNTDYLSIVRYINDRRKCALRRDTCMLRGLFKYHLHNIGIDNIKKISAYKDDKDGNIYNYTFS